MRVVVVGSDGAAVAVAVQELRRAGDRAAGLVGRPGHPADEASARDMGAEMLGGVDRVVALDG